VAQCIWLLASVLGLEQRLSIHIDNLRNQPFSNYSESVHSDRVQQMLAKLAIPSTPRDLTEDQRADQIIKRAEDFIEESERFRNTWQ
jgi:hypothetical protein